MNKKINSKSFIYKISKLEKIVINYLNKDNWLWMLLIYCNNIKKSDKNISYSLLNIYNDNDKYMINYTKFNDKEIYCIKEMKTGKENDIDIEFFSLPHLIANLIYLSFKSEKHPQIDLLFSIQTKDVDFNKIIKDEAIETKKDNSIEDINKCAYSILTQSIHLVIDKIIEDIFYGFNNIEKQKIIGNSYPFVFHLNILNNSSLQDKRIPCHFIILSHNSDSKNINISDCKIYLEDKRYCLISNERVF